MAETPNTKSYDAALRREQAELQAKSARIEGEIQKLLAITCEVTS